MRLVLVVGTTRTAAIDGISAAGADPAAMAHTPAADAELVEFGRPVLAPGVPVSPTGCPTPAVVTRAVRELVGFDLLVLDAGLAGPTAATAVTVGSRPGDDVRDAEPVPNADAVYAAAREVASDGPEDGAVVIGESVPGGTTTALGVLRALGEPHAVSSSLPENPVGLKRDVVATGLAASDLTAGDLSDRPVEAVRRMGDPVLAAVAGFVAGAAEAGTSVTLAGGTQLVAAAALVRHGGGDGRLALATTRYVADDETADVHRAAADLDLDLTVTDPGFEGADHPALAAYGRGEAKEGVAMGGALAHARRAGVPMAAVRERVVEVSDRGVGSDGP